RALLGHAILPRLESRSQPYSAAETPISLLLFCPFLIMPPQPPRSTLFPYTTLFRSQAHPRHAGRDVVRAPPPAARGDARLERRADRKSTRLNSSHRTISYAVFCLKKKTADETRFTSHSR